MLRGLLEAVRESPEDDVPRLVLADWLDDSGEAARAELIRVQCRLGRLDTRHPAYPELCVRQLQLLAEHERDWLGGWAEKLVRWEFERGLLTSITVEPGAFAQAAPLFAEHPIDRVAFVNEEGESLAPEAIRDVLSREHMRHVRAIETAGCRPGEAMAGMFGGEIATSTWLGELARAQNVVRLEELSFFGGTRAGRGEIEPGVWGKFCSAGHLKTLARLDLSDIYQGEWHDEWAGLLRTLAGATFAPNLRALVLQHCMLAEDAVAVLAGTPALAGLEKLDLGRCDLIGTAGVQAVLDSPFLTNLRDVALPYGADLRLLAASARLAGWQSFGLSGYATGGTTTGRNNEGQIAVGRSVAAREWAALLASPHLGPTLLSLSANVDLPPDASRALASARWVRDLEALYLGFFHLDPAPLHALFADRASGMNRLHSVSLRPWPGLLRLLADWPGLAGLTELTVPHEEAGSVEALFRSPHLRPGLARLDVSQCCSTQKDVNALAQCRGLAGLRHLRFAYNSLNGPKMAALAASPYLRHLEALHLGSESDHRQEEGGSVIDAFRILAAPETFPRLRDVVVGSETEPEGIDLLRQRFGPRLRVWCDF